jgi:hypothetical protein
MTNAIDTTLADFVNYIVELEGMADSDSEGMMLGWENGLTVYMSDMNNNGSEFTAVGVKFGTVLDDPITLPPIKNGNGKFAEWRLRSFYIHRAIEQANAAIAALEDAEKLHEQI